jgi:Ca2+/Na+ antiporter
MKWEFTGIVIQMSSMVDEVGVVEGFLMVIVMPICTLGLILGVINNAVGVIYVLAIGTATVFILDAIQGTAIQDIGGNCLLWLIAIAVCTFIALIAGSFKSLIFCVLTVAFIVLLIYLAKGEEEERLRKEEEKERIAKAKRAREREKFERAQEEKGLLKFVSYDGEERWGLPEQVRRWKELDIGLSNSFADYTPREFEKFVCDLFRKMGYNAELTPSTGDYGVDVVAQKDGNTVAIQVKKYKEGNMVGAQMVQQTLGAMWKVKADQSIIITTSGFTVYAQEQAREAPIELWDKRTLHEIVRKYMM